MTQLVIVTTPENSGDGTPIATAFDYCNSNFTELYVRAQPSPPPTLVGQTGDEAGMYAYDSTYFYYCFANYDGSSTIWAQVTQVANISISALTNGTSNVEVGLNSNVSVGVAGNDNVVVIASSGEFVQGVVSATGNITGNYILGNGSQLTGLPEIYGNANVGAYLTTYTGNLSANNIAVTTRITSDVISASGNITGGNLLATDNVFATGRISATGNIASQGVISATGNIETAGYFVGTFVGNVTGNFVVPGANTQVLFNTNGNADAVGGFTFDTNGPNLLTVLGTISSQGNVLAGNVLTAGFVSATGNVRGGNINTAGLITATGNIIGGNLITAGLLTATGNIAGGNLITAGLITATGNITGGNLRTAGLITATGNIAGGNLKAITDLDVGGNATATGFTGNFVSMVGNVTGGNLLTGGIVSATANVTGANIATGGVITATGNVTGGNILTGGLISATSTIISAANITGANLITSGLVTATGNVTGGNVLTGGAFSATGNVTGGNVLTGGAFSATGNVTGGNILTGGLITATGNITGGNIITSGLITATGNIQGGNLRTATLVTNIGDGGVAILNGGSNGAGNIGNSSGYFNTIFATATTALYADLAECYTADADYEPGTVIEFGGSAEVTACDSDMSVTVAGVISTKPAYQMNSGLSAKHVATVALTGRVPCRVKGPVRKGAMMVSAGNGHARSETNPVIGSVIGKAVESFDGESGVIEIAVGRL